MSKKTRLTASVIERVWSLYDLGWRESDIAKKLKISNTSVQRCIYALQIAKSGQRVEYVGLLRDSHHIADYANERFELAATDVAQNDLELAAAINRLASSIEKHTQLFDSFFKKLER
jgi:DNA-binding transcriptional regulator LsrR (DeoR family)